MGLLFLNLQKRTLLNYSFFYKSNVRSFPKKQKRNLSRKGYQPVIVESQEFAGCPLGGAHPDPLPKIPTPKLVGME